MAKKVCMVVQAPNVMGGIAAVVNGYRHSCLEKDFQITFVESYRNGGKVVKLLKAIKAYFVFFGIMLFHKPDLVHIHSSFGPSFYRKIPFILMSNWFRIPVINHIHGADFNEFYMKADRTKKNRIKKIYNKCAKLIALSDEWKTQLSQVVPADHIVVLENYSVLQDGETVHSNRNIVLFMGAIEERKGCFDVPQIFKRVSSEVPDCTLVMAGDGDDRIVKAVKESFGDSLNRNVFFPGWIRGDQRKQNLEESDLFLLPSYNEGMPMAILDAMGYGLPIISTNVGGISKLVHEGENGFLCKPGDIEEFAEKIIYYLNNKEARIEAGNVSKRIVRENYTLDKHLQQLERLYEEVMIDASNTKIHP